MAKLTTLDAVKMHRADADAIVAAGEVVDLRFVSGGSLGLRAAKLFCLLIYEAGVKVAEPMQHRITYASLNENLHQSRDELVEAITELHGTVVSVQLVNSKGRPFTKSGPILSDVEREPDDLHDAEIRVEFSPTMRRVIADSNHWAAVSRRAVLAFSSKYALRLYLHLSLRVNLRKSSETIPIDDLRDILGVPSNKLKPWHNLKTRAIDLAIAEVNQLAGFTATYRPIKRGRRIVAIELAWGRKAVPDLIETQRELDRPRIGRTARRDGLVETIADERHRLAESLANAPGLGRTEPEHMSQRETGQKWPEPDGAYDD
jgi:hypothetical protein